MLKFYVTVNQKSDDEFDVGLNYNGGFMNYKILSTKLSIQKKEIIQEVFYAVEKMMDTIDNKHKDGIVSS